MADAEAPRTLTHVAKAPDWRPGDPRPDVPSMLRVDQAGEYGATRIYAGQLAALGEGHRAAHLIAGMAQQEERHLAAFNTMLAERRVRPTLLQPFWRVAGHALGAGTALLGPRAAMACTAAVEDEIDAHYEQQLQALGKTDPPLSDAILDFQADEREHRDTAIEHGAEQTAGYPLLYAAIRAGCRVAIAFSKRI